MPTAELAKALHEAILHAPTLKETSKKLNRELDVSAYDAPEVFRPHFTLVQSERQFETRSEGILPLSIMIVGKNTYDFKEYFKGRFPAIRYLDLIFNGGTETKAAWVLAESEMTSNTGTLADFLLKCGATVDEIDLDANSEASEGEDDDDDDVEDEDDEDEMDDDE